MNPWPFYDGGYTDTPEDPRPVPASCLMPGCFSSASAFAVDNRARFKHVCRFCYADMRPEEREHYALENRIK